MVQSRTASAWKRFSGKISSPFWNDTIIIPNNDGMHHCIFKNFCKFTKAGVRLCFSRRMQSVAAFTKTVWRRNTSQAVALWEERARRWYLPPPRCGKWQKPRNSPAQACFVAFCRAAGGFARTPKQMKRTYLHSSCRIWRRRTIRSVLLRANRICRAASVRPARSAI